MVETNMLQETFASEIPVILEPELANRFSERTDCKYFRLCRLVWQHAARD